MQLCLQQRITQRAAAFRRIHYTLVTAFERRNRSREGPPDAAHPRAHSHSLLHLQPKRSPARASPSLSGGGAREERCRSAAVTAKPQKMPRRRKPTTSSGSAGSQRRRSFQSDSSDDWEYEPTRGEVYRDRFYAILRFLWDTTKLTMVWLSFVWLAAHLFDEWSLRDARKYIEVAEQMATKSDLNGARDAYAVALGHLQRAEVREPFASSALAAGGRLFRLPVLFLLRNPWPAVEARLIALAATIRALASVPEPGENWERR